MKYLISNKNLGLITLTKDYINETYLSWLNDPETNKYMAAGLTKKSMKDLEAYYEKVSKEKNGIYFVIIDMKTNTHIGNVKLFNIDERNRICEFGILIGDKNYWGKGSATEATELALEYAFAKLNLRKVSLGVLKDNDKAVKLYERTGFVEEGCEKDMYWFNDKYSDVLRMGIFKEDFYKKKR